MRFNLSTLAWMVLLPLFFLNQARAQTAAPDSFRMSLGVSPSSEFLLNIFHPSFSDENSSVSYKTVSELQSYFISKGSSDTFFRLGSNRHLNPNAANDSSLARALERAKMAKSLNTPLNVELGMFNYYGDVRCQPEPDFSEYPEIQVPAPWSALTLEQMESLFTQLAKIQAREILATGVQVNVWDIGNEVEYGFAGLAIQPLSASDCSSTGSSTWYHAPNGVNPAIGDMNIGKLSAMSRVNQIEWLKKNLWPHQVRLMNAVKKGIQEVAPAGARFSTHISGQGATDADFTVAFYQVMNDEGFLPDELGVSFYPSNSSFPSDRLAAFKQVVTSLKEKFNRPVFISEFAYPASLITSGPFASWNNAMPGYPLTPSGQAALIHDIISWGQLNNVSGLRYWAPDAIVFLWQPLSLFSFDMGTQKAVANPALLEFKTH